MTIEQLPNRKHFTTSAFVVNKERTKTLLIFHKKIKRWMYAGGHYEENETPEGAALRELKEETGINAKIIDSSPKIDLSNSTEVQLPLPYCTLAMKIKGSEKESEHTHIDFVYLVEAEETDLLENKEGLSVRWFTLAELEKLDTFESIKNIAKYELK